MGAARYARNAGEPPKSTSSSLIASFLANRSTEPCASCAEAHEMRMPTTTGRYWAWDTQGEKQARAPYILPFHLSSASAPINRYFFPLLCAEKATFQPCPNRRRATPSAICCRCFFRFSWAKLETVSDSCRKSALDGRLLAFHRSRRSRFEWLCASVAECETAERTCCHRIGTWMNFIFQLTFYVFLSSVSSYP